MGILTLVISISELSDPDARVSSVKDSLLSLPPAHYSTLRAIILHLGRYVTLPVQVDTLPCTVTS